MSITQLARHSIVYGLGHILSRFITFLLLPILTSSLSTMDFGAISKFYAFTGFAMAFYRYGMDTALMKFYIENNNDQSYFSSIFFLQILSSLLFSFFLYLFSHYLSTWIFGFYNFKYMVYMISIIFSDIVWNLNAITLRAEKKPVSYIVLNLINVSTILILTIIYVNHLSMGIGGVLFANLFGSVLTLFFSLYILSQ